MDALLKSLVGAHIEYWSRTSGEDSASWERVLRSERKKIQETIEIAEQSSTTAKIMLYVEMLNYYRNQPFYMMIRSSIVLGRVRPQVIKLLSRLNSTERCFMLSEALNKGPKDPDRKTYVATASFMLRTYERHLPALRKFLTSEELLTCV